METLLHSNNISALVGGSDGNVRTVQRADGQSDDEWERQLRDVYGEPWHWYPDESGVPFTKSNGLSYVSETERRLECSEGVAAYQVFSDNNGLSVRAAFDTNINRWYIADRQREPDRVDGA